MSSQASQQLFARSLLVLVVVAVASSSARSAHFDASQVAQDQESAGSLVDTGLTPLQLEILAQRLSEYNNQIPQMPAAWERLVRNPEVKRQSRYRQCYFNPISCFRK